LPHVVGQAKAGAKDAEATDDVKSIDKHLAAALCFKCGRAASLHALPARDPLGAAADGFLVELCRVGSVGWESHAFMHAVYDRRHLGVQFTEKDVDESHRLYEQHVRLLLYGGSVDIERFKDLAVPTLPDVTVYTITDGKTKEGQMKPLLEQRRAEFERLCDHISLLTGATSSPVSPSAHPTSSVSSGKSAPAGAAAGGSPTASAAAAPSAKASGGSAASSTSKSTASPRTPAAVASKAHPSPAPLAAVSPTAGGGAAAAAAQARPALQSMTAQDVASAVGCIGPPYKAYEQSIVDNGIDGEMVAHVVGLPDADALDFLSSLGIPPPVHNRKVLMLFRSWVS
jgi:hypothetical protein